MKAKISPSHVRPHISAVAGILEPGPPVSRASCIGLFPSRYQPLW
jgi:hypothetical protein